MKQTRTWALSERLYAMLACMLLGLAVYGTYSVLQLRQQILVEKKIALRALVDSSLGVIQQQYTLYQKGKLTLAQAQKLAEDDLRKSRYNQGDYFFIYDLNGVNIMHAAKPEREGKNFINTKDTNGKYYIKEWIDELRQDRQGYIDYMFPKQGSTVPLPKVSYAKVFEPWGWWVGTGVYITDVDQDFREAAYKSIAFLVLIGSVLVAIGWAINRSVQRQLGGEPAQAVNAVEHFAGGDLTRQIVSYSQQPGNLLGALSRMQTRMKDIVSNIRASTGLLARQSSALSVTANQISHATSAQAESSASASVSLRQLTASIHHVSEIAHSTEDNALKTVALADRGGQAVHQAAQEIENIASSVSDSTERIHSLVERSKEIGKITQVIQEIAAQTNLLALNAAIEAARAGEQGRGFAVVADEVRRLSERTALATSEIANMIAAIQLDTQQAVDAMESTLPRVQQGQALAREATRALGDIQQQAQDSRLKAREVSEANQQQVDSASQLASHVDDMASMAEQTKAATRNNVQAAEQLNSLSDQLRSAMDFFKL